MSSAKYPEVAIVDCGSGNVYSVANALRYVAPKLSIGVVRCPEVLLAAHRVVMPGQGAMPHCLNHMTQSGLWEAVQQSLLQKPFLGICVGLQALFSCSEEGGQEGFSFFAGKVSKLSATDSQVKVPHMGWNTILLEQAHPLWQGIASESRFYFVHSYAALDVSCPDVVAVTEHGQKFASAVARDNVFAVQFHPEKSAQVGLKLIENFLSWNA